MMISWLEDAVDDLQSLHEYIAENNPRAANAIAKRIVHAVDLLATQPNMGRPGRVLHTRELIISGTPFIIPYIAENNTITLLRVLHGAMRWPEKL